jgi:hypothetical protein
MVRSREVLGIYYLPKKDANDPEKRSQIPGVVIGSKWIVLFDSSNRKGKRFCAHRYQCSLHFWFFEKFKTSHFYVF